MCGIAGMLGSPDREVVKRMTLQLQQRGPDGDGFYFDELIGMGHRRLKIIDLSEAGDQPMSRANGKLQIMYNGELYNFREIRSTLEKKGYSFVSECDTEVILAAYEEFGDSCLDLFYGMFSFAIWDRRENTPELFIVRDHLGIKPLVYSVVGEQFIFASELKALIVSGLVDATPDSFGLQQLLINGYIVQPRTYFENIKALPAGHFIRVKPGEQPRIKKYWEIDYSRSVELSRQMDYRQQVERVRELLEESIRYRMISDVPLGAFLSSGIDSNAIVGLMSKQIPDSIKTFSVGFGGEGGEIDETEEARKSAEFLQTDHSEVRFSGDELGEVFPDLALTIDQPTTGSAHWSIVSHAARQRVTVALSGLGADEVFCGYENLFLGLDRIWSDDGRLLKPFLPYVAKSGIWKVLPGQPGKKKWEALGMMTTIPDQYARWHLIHHPSAAARLIEGSNGKFTGFGYYSEGDGSESLEPVTRLSNLVTKYWMISKELRDIDAASMSHSLEVRVPFLHKPLVEFALGLPGSSKVGAMSAGEDPRGKRILVDAVKDVIPPWTYSKRKKGFFMPYHDWLSGPLKPLVNDLFASSEFRQSGLFRVREVEKEWMKFQAGNARWSHIWMILTTALYQRGIKRLVHG